MVLKELACKVQNLGDVDYDTKYQTLSEAECYEEMAIADAYYKVERDLSVEYGTEVMLEPSVRMGHGCVDVYTEGGCGNRIATYSFEDEIEAAWKALADWDGDDEDVLIDALATEVACLVAKGGVEE